MFKTSVITRGISFAILIALLLASFPTAAGAATTSKPGVEAKWTKLLDIYNRQSVIHNSAPRWVAQWMADHPRASKSKKAELLKTLAASNTAWAAATSIVLSHRGFDANGNVVDKAAAKQSIKELSKALHRYTRSIKNLKSLIRQYNLEV